MGDAFEAVTMSKARALGLLAAVVLAACAPGPPLAPPGGWEGGEVAYVRFGAAADTIWVAPPSDLQRGRLLARVPHASGWGISASLSPDGRRVAYVALPPTVSQPAKDVSRAGEVWLLSLADGERRLLAQGADVRLAPVWSPDARRLAFRSVEGDAATIWTVEVAEGEARPLAQLVGASPLGFSPDARTLYLVQGSSLLALDIASGAVGPLPPVPAGQVEEWSVSPDGARVAAVVREGGRWALWVLDTASRTWQEGGLEAWAPLFRPLWGPGGRALAVGLAPTDRPRGVVVVGEGPVQELTAPEAGFDVPLAWAPQGRALLVAHYAAYPVQEEPDLAVVTEQGLRLPFMEGTGITVLGWLEGKGS